MINQVHGSPSASRDEPELRAVNRIHGGAVEVPGLGTPGQRRAESEGRRGGRPQTVGNLAGDRRRSCLHPGREIPTLPQRSSSMTDTETTRIGGCVMM